MPQPRSRQDIEWEGYTRGHDDSRSVDSIVNDIDDVDVDVDVVVAAIVVVAATAAVATARALGGECPEKVLQVRLPVPLRLLRVQDSERRRTRCTGHRMHEVDEGGTERIPPAERVAFLPLEVRVGVRPAGRLS